MVSSNHNSMLSQTKTTPTIFAILALTSAATFEASAVQTIRVWDGINAPLLVADETLGDASGSSPGVVAIGGLSYYGWSIDLAYSLSKPFAGSAVHPEFSMYASAVSSGAGSLILQFSDDGFGPTFGGYSLSYGGETAPTSNTVYKAYVDNTNTLFGGSVLANTVNSGPFSQDTSGTFALSGPYSLTHEVRFTHLSGTSSSIHAEFRATPVPDGGSTLALFASTLLPLGILRKKFRL